MLAKNIKKAVKKYSTGGFEIYREIYIGSSKGDFWQPLIAPEARKERSYQSFSVSHIGPRADCAFNRPAFFRPASSDEVAMASASDVSRERSTCFTCRDLNQGVNFWRKNRN